MIRHALITAAVLSLVHVAIIFTCDDLFPGLAETHRESNQRKAKQFLKTWEDFDYVVVGSSMADKIETELFAKPAFNLGFVGRGALEGLHLASQNCRSGQTILIEINVLDRSEDENLIKELQNPLSSFFAPRREHKPVEYFVFGLSNLLRGGGVPATPTKGEEENDVIRPEVAASALKKNLEAWSKAPLKSKLESNMEAVESYVAELEQRGCRAVFFEMPAHAEVTDSAKTNTIRSAVKSHLLAKQRLFIAAPATDQYLTRDGVHLDKASAKRFSKYLNDKLEADGFK